MNWDGPQSTSPTHARAANAENIGFTGHRRFIPARVRMAAFDSPWESPCWVFPVFASDDPAFRSAAQFPRSRQIAIQERPEWVIRARACSGSVSESVRHQVLSRRSIKREIQRVQGREARPPMGRVNTIRWNLPSANAGELRQFGRNHQVRLKCLARLAAGKQIVKICAL